MRRGLAGLILGLSLVLASVAWAGFVMSRTVLDPGRSERLADQVFENEQLRGALSERLATGLQSVIPGDIPVPPELLEQAADLALDDPAVQTLVRDGIVATHRNALEGNSEPVTLDASALGVAGREALVSLRPELAAVVPEIPPVEVTLPTGKLSFLGTIRDFVERFTTICAVLALVGSLSALLLTTDRPAILRRVSFWAFGAAAFWMVVGFGVPWMAKTLAPSSDAIVAAMVDVFFGAMIPPAITMAVVGAALFGASLLWSAVPTGDARQPAMAHAGGQQQAQPQQGRRQQTDRRTVAGSTSNIRPARQDPSQSIPEQRAPQQRAPQQHAPQHQPQHTPPQYFPQQAGQIPIAHQQQRPGAQHGQPVDPTVVQGFPPQGTPGAAAAGSLNPRPVEPDPWEATRPHPIQPDKPQPKWVDGVGYVDPEQPTN